MILISILIIKIERSLSTYIVIFIPKIIIILNSWTKANYSLKWLYHWTNISTTYNTYICTIYHPVQPITKICTLKIQKKIMSNTHIVKLPPYYTSTNMIHICSNLCTEVTTSILWGSIDRPGNNLNFMANSIKKEFELWINYWQFLWIHITSNRGRCTVMATWIKVT